ncbi:hypothetical protein ACGFIV_31700 [Sphaerisporangium sp. NPDC049003]|uniref:hypothetical protein n=1 Tax=Sphaerisporangium sp. NPDC049003 TaxID=3364517 RepID=UPI00370F918C
MASLGQSKMAKRERPDGRLHLRTLVILTLAAAAAVSAAAPAWLVVAHILDGRGGPAVPLSAALVAGESQFIKAFDLLDRIVR